MSWIVTWMVISWSIIACPPPEPVYDVYRGEVQQMNLELVACYDTTIKPMEKYFGTYEEALEFVKNGRGQCDGTNTDFGYIGDCDLKDFEIREIR